MSPLRRPGRRALVALLLLALIGAMGAGVTFSAFTAQTDDPDNSFATGGFQGMRVATGSYTGNDVDDREITISPSFRPSVVIVKRDGAVGSGIRTASFSGDVTKALVGGAYGPNLIQTLNSNGFQVGTDASVNANGASYHYVAFRRAPGQLAVGSHGGTGALNSISGLSFSPDYVIVMGESGTGALQRSTTMTSSHRFGTVPALASGITALGADGFTLGTSAEANAAGSHYHWLAFNDVPGLVTASSYTGDGQDGRAIADFGAQPDYLIVRSDTDTTTDGCDRTVARTGSLVDDSSIYFDAAANSPNLIQALNSDGFEVGTDCTVNNNATTYHWLGFRDAGADVAGGCSAPATTTLIASADSWVDEAAPTSTHGSETVLNVRSQSTANRRGLVRFSLPAAPSGCVVVNAKLRLHNATPASGRTINVHRAVGSWTEGTVDWNSQPATPGPGVPVPSGAAAGPMTWTVTGQVLAMYLLGNDGFVIRDSAEGAATAAEQVFSSREGAVGNRPQLTITFG